VSARDLTAPNTLAHRLGTVAEEAGRLLHAMQRDLDVGAAGLRTEEKGRADLVTDADRASERLVRARLEAMFPGASMLLEEGGRAEIPRVDQRAGEDFSRLTLVVDPLDGTTNFAAGMPHYGVSIAALDDDGPRAGAVYDPARRELFLAERGQQTVLVSPDNPGGRPLFVSATESLKDSVVVTGFAYDRYTNPDDNHAEFAAFNLLTRGARRYGAACLDFAWVAAGRFDGFWERGLSPWDVSAGLLLVAGAGGTLSDYAGRPTGPERREVLATNGKLHSAMGDVLMRIRRRREEHA
jgi:myo-inositol-1(or 4)-monophosphatase